jgi:glycosyltransferase involved in cell wall biosynthesis
MATGRAIITSDAPGCRETVIQGINGILVPPRDGDRLATAIASIIQNPALAIGMGKASRRLAEQKFDVREVNAIMLTRMGLRRQVDDPIG